LSSSITSVNGFGTNQSRLPTPPTHTQHGIHNAPHSIATFDSNISTAPNFRSMTALVNETNRLANYNTWVTQHTFSFSLPEHSRTPAHQQRANRSTMVSEVVVLFSAISDHATCCKHRSDLCRRVSTCEYFSWLCSYSSWWSCLTCRGLGLTVAYSAVAASFQKPAWQFVPQCGHPVSP